LIEIQSPITAKVYRRGHLSTIPRFSAETLFNVSSGKLELITR
jgi:hypothetical protein